MSNTLRSPPPRTLRRYDLPRGVYRSEEPLDGEYTYMAISEDGYRLAYTRPRVGESDAEVRLGLWQLIRDVEALRPRPRHLHLI